MVVERRFIWGFLRAICILAQGFVDGIDADEGRGLIGGGNKEERGKGEERERDGGKGEG